MAFSLRRMESIHTRAEVVRNNQAQRLDEARSGEQRALAGALMLLTAWLVWEGNHWGTIAAIALQVLSVLASLPWFADMDDAAVGGSVVFFIALSVAPIALLLMRESRTYWRA